ncbi:hypothetical protein Goari_024244 [Gossypium aridum]|uniref:Uncharacterized protein n=1 Tax=Gossypium aridum TaxID=34290 RepID=A0A7J8X5P1_GOSAI|nr:hypothetical protein [Gossypium aridum]
MALGLSSIFVIMIFAISFTNLAPVLLVLARKPCRLFTIFNFGDSNSDIEGLSAAFGAPAGRYTDDRFLIDFIETSLLSSLQFGLKMDGSLLSILA